MPDDDSAGGAADDARLTPAIHCVTDDAILARPTFPEDASAVMRALGNRGAVHLRGRATTGARLLEIAMQLNAAAPSTGCWLVVNDRVDIALVAAATAVQLTSRSMRVADARRIAPSLPIGASVHAVAEGRAAEREGARWIVAGHVYESRTHPTDEPRGLDFVRQLAGSVHLPCIAIGGITPARVAAVLGAGACGVAAIGGIWHAGDAERAAIDYLSAYDAGHDHA